MFIVFLLYFYKDIYSNFVRNISKLLALKLLKNGACRNLKEIKINHKRKNNSTFDKCDRVTLSVVYTAVESI